MESDKSESKVMRLNPYDDFCSGSLGTVCIFNLFAGQTTAFAVRNFDNSTRNLANSHLQK